MKKQRKGINAAAWFYGTSFNGRVQPCTHKGRDFATCHCLCAVCGLEDCRCCAICNKPDCEHAREEGN
jgi:hypothetical protein